MKTIEEQEKELLEVKEALQVKNCAGCRYKPDFVDVGNGNVYGVCKGNGLHPPSDGGYPYHLFRLISDGCNGEYLRCCSGSIIKQCNWYEPCNDTGYSIEDVERRLELVSVAKRAISAIGDGSWYFNEQTNTAAMICSITDKLIVVGCRLIVVGHGISMQFSV